MERSLSHAGVAEVSPPARELKAELADNPVIQRALRRLRESGKNDRHVSHHTKHTSHSVKHSSTW